jgi:hypothetical protein
MKYAFVIAVASAAIAAPVWAADTAAQLNAQELARIQSGGPASMAPPPMASAPTMASAPGCGPGRQFVPEGYIKRGKWRPAGCVRIR